MAYRDADYSELALLRTQFFFLRVTELFACLRVPVAKLSDRGTHDDFA